MGSSIYKRFGQHSLIFLVHAITGIGSIEEVTSEMIIKGSFEWTGKDGVNMEVTAYAKAKNRKIGSI